MFVPNISAEMLRKVYIMWSCIVDDDAWDGC